ncbi:MAG: T9SS type A sorting domain-containing protein [Ignavibacteria bacterium]|nr:T9SS type A sorting domain-containing protein [Ignavibacteria bacterium]
MKKILLIFIFSLYISLFSNITFSQVPTYTLTATNFNRSAPDSLTFEIYLFQTGSTQFEYPAGQYFFKFNPLIANGGTLRYRIIGTGLPSAAVPQNASISNNELRLASNLPVPQGAAPIISNTGKGTLIVRMSLKTTAGSFDQSQPLNLTWKNPPEPGFTTKISAYVGTFIQEITTSATHFVDTNTISISQISGLVPDEYKIFQNYPNPFNPATVIRYSIVENGFTSLKIYNSIGKEVETLVNQKQNAGTYEFKWDASKYSSGIYFYRLQSQDYIETKKMMLLK